MKIFTVLGGREGRGYSKFPHTVTAESFKQAAEIVKKLGLIQEYNEVVLIQRVQGEHPNSWSYHDGKNKLTYDISGATPILIGRHGRTLHKNPRRRAKYRVRKNFKRYGFRKKVGRKKSRRGRR